MKTKIYGIGKWLLLAVFVLTAGICYSCGQGEAPSGYVESAPPLEAEAVAVVAESEASSQEAAVPQICFVHVCGEVSSPGVYELTEGQRVYEAVKLAGGFTALAAEHYLNLAEPVSDGMKVQVPSLEQVEQLPDGILTGGNFQGNGSSVESETSARININTATKEELMTLRGIGAARAEDIVRYRQQRGGFERIEDIMEVSGIKDAAFQKIKDDITV